MAEIKITEHTAPVYTEIKVPVLTSTYSIKDFRSYERQAVDPSASGTQIMSDDVDDGGGQSGTGA